MAEPTQAGAAAACPGPPHRCPHSGSCLGPLVPLQAPMAAWPLCWLGPHRDSPTSSRGFCGLPVGWESVRSWRGLGRRRGPCSAVPAMPAWLPAAAFAPCLGGRRKSLQTLGSALPLLRALGEWSSGAQAAGHRLVPCLLHCSGCCTAVLQRFWGVQPLGVVVGSNLAAAVPTPVPWRCLSLLPPWPGCGQAAAVPAERVPGWQDLGLRGAALGARGRGRADWQREGERAAWEPSRGPGAAAASGGVNIVPTHGDVTWGTLMGPAAMGGVWWPCSDSPQISHGVQVLCLCPGSSLPSQTSWCLGPERPQAAADHGAGMFGVPLAHHSRHGGFLRLLGQWGARPACVPMVGKGYPSGLVPVGRGWWLSLCQRPCTPRAPLLAMQGWISTRSCTASRPRRG